MKKYFLITASLLNTFFLFAQNVGIGTVTPKNKFSVNGTIAIDHDYTNNGTLDSASLLFGNNSKVGITSNKNNALIGYNGMDIWTNASKRISINEAGSVGIGITGPQHKLHVGGEIVAFDYILAGSSLRAGNLPFSNSYKLQVNGGNSFLGGKLFVGGTTIGSEQLYVTGAGGGANSARFTNGDVVVADNFSTGGNATVSGNFTANTMLSETTARINGYMSIGGVLDNNYKLRVYDGNARIGGEFHATGNSAVGGLPDANFRFRVYDGNSRFGGDVQVTGNVNAGEVTTNTINGNGVVKSNGPSQLRIGFDSKNINHQFSPGEVHFMTATLSTPISGNNNDFRILMSQYDNGPGGEDVMQFFGVTITNINAAANTCDIRLKNLSGATITLIGTMYLTTIAKN